MVYIVHNIQFVYLEAKNQCTSAFCAGRKWHIMWADTFIQWSWSTTSDGTLQRETCMFSKRFNSNVHWKDCVLQAHWKRGYSLFMIDGLHSMGLYFTGFNDCMQHVVWSVFCICISWFTENINKQETTKKQRRELVLLYVLKPAIFFFPRLLEVSRNILWTQH